jgi:glutamate formiminotransferase / formiminotetrahydrofolate cyclodeaminase
MPTPLVECIPNFSEGRRPEVVAAIVTAICSVPEVTLLNQSSDSDHNRTVVTFAGPPLAVSEAAFLGIKKAAQLINLDEHTGSHPRLGATDVVPFVPLSGIEMAECIQLARALGQRVGTELNIPVYLYEEAATRPERTNLEDVRRGQYEALKIEINTNPLRRPDFGPAQLGPAGATIIGARNPLVAFNVYLTTSDVSVAKAIAKAMRASSGGFRYVKGLGMLVDGRAQVSMNLTNFHQTPVFRVVEAIRREAERYGVAIHHSELIGLIPGEALMDAAAWYLQIDNFQPEQVLENRLYAAQTGLATGPGFLDSLAAGTPTPGGGSAAAYTGAMAAALVAMVARLTIGKKKYTDVEAQMLEILNQAEHLRAEMTSAITEDSEAFEAILAAFKLPKSDETQQATRSEAIESATLQAAIVPLVTAEKAIKVMALAERCTALGNLNAISDAASAAALARAAYTSASYNVQINLNGLSDKSVGEPMLAQLSDLDQKASRLETDIQLTMETRGGLKTG